jgi:hypothetical protein
LIGGQIGGNRCQAMRIPSTSVSETSLILSVPDRFAFRRVMRNAIKRKLYRVETRKYAEKSAQRFHFGDRVARIIQEAQCPVFASVEIKPSPQGCVSPLLR